MVGVGWAHPVLSWSLRHLRMPRAVDNSTACDNGPHGDDRFRHRLRTHEKRAEDAGLSRKRSLHNISANAKRTDFALAA